MPKVGITKKRISITIDLDLIRKIERQCEKRTMKVSSYIEKLVKMGYKVEKNK